MRVFNCPCSSTIFFENTHCLSCASELAWCPGCHTMTALIPGQFVGQYQCGHQNCNAQLTKCHNYEYEQVCNRCSLATDEAAELCEYCRHNDTIPDLSIDGNRELWRELEIAKRRLFYALNLLQLPIGTAANGIKPPLSFDFKADTIKQPKWWWQMSKTDRVFTGHASGKITINIVEADSVAREQARINLDEAHRTLIGHFRHEIGHYYWEMLVVGDLLQEFVALFGDHQNPGYGEAQTRYYEQGALANWQASYISAYATMHPWEDFAETFALYMNIVSVLDTALNMGLSSINPLTATVTEMVEQYGHVGVVLNEMNRAMGLLDLIPETVAKPVVTKLEYIDRLVKTAKP